MKIILKYLGVFIAVSVVVFFILYSTNNIGVNRQHIEYNARITQKIADDLKVVKQTTKTISVMIFYDDNLSKHTFSIYVNRNDISFGYFFRGGGSIEIIKENVAEIHIDGYDEYAYISMNKQQVSKIEINNGQTIEIIKVDSTKPFVFIPPINTGIITIYDMNGNIVESVKKNI
jgi:hypothetical protein